MSRAMRNLKVLSGKADGQDLLSVVRDNDRLSSALLSAQQMLRDAWARQPKSERLELSEPEAFHLMTRITRALDER